MLVCRFWREIAVHSPRLWQSIDVQRSVRWLEIALDRSGNMPLELVFHHLDTARDAIPTILPHTQRLHKLILPPLDQIHPAASPPRIHRTDIMPFLPLVCAVMPTLTVLTFPAHHTNHTDEFVRPRLGWLTTPPPSLRVLRIACVSVPWSTALLSKVTRLELRACTSDGPALSCDGFLDVLGACIALAELKLIDTFVSSTLRPDAIHTWKAGAMKRATLELPKLRTFVLADYPSVTAWLSSCLVFTDRASVTIEGWLPEDTDDFGPLSGAFLSIMSYPEAWTRLFPTTAPTNAWSTLR